MIRAGQFYCIYFKSLKCHALQGRSISTIYPRWFQNDQKLYPRVIFNFWPIFDRHGPPYGRCHRSLRHHLPPDDGVSPWVTSITILSLFPLSAAVSIFGGNSSESMIYRHKRRRVEGGVCGRFGKVWSSPFWLTSGKITDETVRHAMMRSDACRRN